jgi:GTP-binding protein
MPIAAGKDGWASLEYPTTPGSNMEPLLATIASHVPPPAADPAAPFRLLVTMIEHDAYLGRVSTGRVAAGTLRVGDPLKLMTASTGVGDGGASPGDVEMGKVSSAMID